MNNIDKLFEQIDNLSENKFNKLTKKYLDKINLKQKQEFHLRFPNLELNKFSKIDCIGQTFYYYKFSSQNHSYEFEINKSHKNKYSFQFFVNNKLEMSTTKITQKNTFTEDQLDIKKHFEYIANYDIIVDDLHEIINWLFLHEKFIYNV